MPARAALLNWPLRRPRAALALAGLLLVAALAGLSRLQLETRVTRLLPGPAAEALERADAVFGLTERLMLLVEGDDPSALDAAIGRLTRALVDGGLTVDPPLAADPARLDRLLPLALLYWEPAALARRLSDDGLRDQLEVALERLSMPGLGEADDWVRRDPLGLTAPLVARLRSMAGSGARPERDWRLVSVTAPVPSSDLAGARSVAATVREAIAAAGAAVVVHATGGHLLAAETDRIITRDLTRSLSISITLAAVLVALGLRLALRGVPLLMLPTLWGCVVGIGAYVAVHPGLAAMSLGCSAVLIGLGVDFTIHLVAAAQAARAAGAERDDAIAAATRDVAGRMSLGALTSIAAFAALTATDLRVLREMGGLTACGIAGSLLGALLVLPPLLRWALAPRPPRPSRVAPWLAATSARHPRTVLIGCALISAAALWTLVQRPPELEDDLRRIHARDSAPLAAERHIAGRLGHASDPLLLVVEADDVEALDVACQQLQTPLAALVARGQLAAWRSPAALLPAPAQQAAVRAGLRAAPAGVLARRLAAALDEAGFDPAAFAPYLARLATARELPPLTGANLDRLGLGPLSRLVRPAGSRWHALLTLRPSRPIWTAADRRQLQAAIDGALADAGARGTLTGGPLVSAEAAERVAGGFARAWWMTLAAVLVVLLARFRRPLRVAWVLLPAGLGALWTAGLLSACGVRLNMMNLGILPMVLALGVDDGIHLVAIHLTDDDPLAPYAASGTAVLLTSLTTMVTFGSLALSESQGLASVGLLTLFGIGACLVASLVVLPATRALRR